MSWHELDSLGVQSIASPVESERFGRTVRRITVGVRTPREQSLRDFGDLVGAADEDVVIARWSASEPRLGAVLAGSGRHVIPTDTLVYWETQTADLASRTGPAQLWAGPITEVLADRSSPHSAAPVATAAQESAVLEVIGASFADYPNHYLSNPLFSAAAAQLGYQDWALRVLRERPEDVIALVGDGAIVGIATVAPCPEGDHLEVLLAGLAPSAQGKGWYAGLLVAVAKQAAAQGLPRIVISTQSGNARVQRAWAAMGLKPFASIATAHAVTSQAWQRSAHVGPP